MASLTSYDIMAIMDVVSCSVVILACNIIL